MTNPEGSTAMNDQNPWKESARMYAQNADYWRERAHRAERFSLSRLIRAIRRRMQP